MAFDWATIAAVTVALAAIIGLLVQFFKKDKPWRKTQIDHNLRLTSLELQTKAIEEKLDILKETIEDHDQRDTKDFERIEGKIEKLTDLMISMLQDGKKPKTKPRSTRTKAKK